MEVAVSFRMSGVWSLAAAALTGAAVQMLLTTRPDWLRFHRVEAPEPEPPVVPEETKPAPRPAAPPMRRAEDREPHHAGERPGYVVGPAPRPPRKPPPEEGKP